MNEGAGVVCVCPSKRLDMRLDICLVEWEKKTEEEGEGEGRERREE